jgi:transcription termination/antitermination protein NusG
MSGDQTQEAPAWFALAVKPRFEKAVARTLEIRGYETLLPVYRKQYREGTQSSDSELPLFPGYVCCRFDVRRRMPILTTPGVTRIVGAGDIPAPLDEMEVASLQKAIRAGIALQPFPFVQVGQRVRIEQGMLAGVEGIMLGLKQTLRLVLSITLLQKSVLLEVARDEVAVSGGAGFMPCQMAEGD